ncbi:MAG TPA: hypothetical protein VN946_23065 [Terriglobales bacterium]|jgi:hypothetical protein|nr:hypothetical protein [Terriglobales bacterium]
MSNIFAIAGGIAFVTLAAANVVVILEASQPSRSITTRTRLIATHREGGYLFVTLLCGHGLQHESETYHSRPS